MKIFVAAGHHATRPGAGRDGFYEHDEAVRWVDELMTQDNRGLLIRVPDGELKKKVDFINYRCRWDDLAVEVHFNAAVDNDGKDVGSGCVTLYMPGSEDGERFARLCQTALTSVFQPDRGVVEGWYRGEKSRGAYFFLEKTRCVATILEPEFVRHREVIQNGRVAACAALYEAWQKMAEAT